MSYIVYRPFNDYEPDIIIHISDLHIRTLSRHEEYQEVFDRFIKEVKAFTADYKVIVVVTGDIAHSKVDVTPEFYSFTRDFFKKLADVCGVIIFPGNHDALMGNSDRLDALSPMFNKYSNPHYYKNSCIVQMGTVLLNHWSIFDEDWISIEDLRVTYPSHTIIGTYHGVVNGCSTDTGQILEGSLSVGDMKGFDAFMLGDIHKRQVLSEEPLVYYPGSMIQQNFGESILGHGYAVYYVENGEVQFKDLDNDYGFVTIPVVDNVAQPDQLSLVKKPRVKLKVQDTDPATVREIKKHIIGQFDVEEVLTARVESAKQDSSVVQKIDLEDIRNVEYQDKLLEEYLLCDKETLEEVQALNAKFNSQLRVKSQIVRNVSWEPVDLEFSNMFSYGEDNYIAFKDMHNVIGLFAENAAGKSSIPEILLFALFDKCSRTSKAAEVLNEQANQFSCKFRFRMSDKTYVIERVGVRNKTSVKVDVEFYEEESGKDLKGDKRATTNKIIRDYVGTYDDLILTSLSLQTDNTHFIDAKQAERKTLFSKFLDIDILEDLHQLGKKDNDEVTTLIKDINSSDYESDLKIYHANKEDLDGDIAELVDLVEEQDRLITKELEDEKQLLSSLLDVKTPTHTLEELKLQKEKYEDFLQKSIEQQEEFLHNIEEVKRNLAASPDVDLYEDRIKQLQQLISELTDLKTKVNNLSIQIGSNQAMQEELGKLRKDLQGSIEYDPDCTYCMRSTKATRDRIVEIERKLDSHQDSLQVLEMQKSQYLEEAKEVSEGKKLVELERHLTDLKHKYDGILSLQVKVKMGETQLKQMTTQQENYQLKIDQLDGQIKEYLENQESISHNESINQQIAHVQIRVKAFKGTKESLENKMEFKKRSVAQIESRIAEIEKKLQRLAELERKNKALELYIKAFHKDSIPLQIIEKTLPVVEDKVNEILGELVEFRLKFAVDGSDIDCRIQYNDTHWPVELTSGMERFMSQLAIRKALIDLSTLPKPNFILIDEGWGSLSKNNLANVAPLLEMLKESFEFSIIISHIDSMRDLVDEYMTITKTPSPTGKGFSKIRYEIG